jgi:hypothetical protein
VTKSLIFFIKACISSIKKPLNFLFNESINQGNKQEASNYIHILVLSIFSKILEKLVYNKLVSFTFKFKILTENQYGFQKNKSTISACQLFVGKIQEALDKRLLPVGIFFDLTKAYDVSNNDILLEKLEHYGMRGQINVWLKSYFTLRAQYVEIISKGNRNSMTRFNSRLR